MRPVQVLLVLSADFGEYVTANLFARGQSFTHHFALPASLARYATARGNDVSTYASVEDLKALMASRRPAVVLLCSAYLFAINRLFGPEQLGALLDFLRQQGVAVATTDPWLRIWSLRPGSRLRIYSVRQGGEDVEQSRNMARLQEHLQQMLSGLPHVFAVPLRGADRRCLSFFNPRFIRAEEAQAAGDRAARDEWLFVLSREDFVFLAGFERERFFEALGHRIEELLSAPRNRLTFIGPEPLGQFLGLRWSGHPRVTFLAFCDVDLFESLIARSRVVAYWNVLSASLLYCLYYRVPPLFFGTGHQAKLCEGLFEHAAEHVYRRRPPVLLDLAAPLTPRADELVRQLDLERWLDLIGEDYGQSPSPDQVIESLLSDHGGN